MNTRLIIFFAGLVTLFVIGLVYLVPREVDRGSFQVRIDAGAGEITDVEVVR